MTKINRSRRKTKKNNNRYNLCLTLDDPSTGKKYNHVIRITNPTLQLILDQEMRNHEG